MAAGIGPWDGRGASAWVRGIGIHLGQSARVRFHPAPGEPVAIVKGNRRLPLEVSQVAGTALSTELAGDGLRVSTVEHLLAALHVLGHWTGLAIEVDGPELPILDGSALGWAAVLSGTAPEPAPAPLVLRHEVALEVRSGYVALEPLGVGEPPSVGVTVAYADPVVGAQAWSGGRAGWSDLLDARTFGFERDLARLWAAGRALGARPDNAVVYGPDGPSLAPRGPDEVVRHKALDLLGDLYLVGRPVRARAIADRASHEAHVALARAALLAGDPE